MKLIIALLFVISINLTAQTNLVSNPSFEDTVRCPYSLAGLLLPSSACKYWYDPDSSTSDYFNSCSQQINDCSIPNNLAGWQYARTGNAYAGFVTNNYTLFVNYREYIQTRLDSTLIENHKYCVEFYISLSNISNLATDNIGMYISNTIPAPPTAPDCYTNCIPQINTPHPITDTANWVLISGTYTALGGEQYITIGNFYTDAQTDTVRVANQNGGDGSYYYIDDVSIVDCTNDGVDELTKQSNYKLYPNPNSGLMTLEY